MGTKLTNNATGRLAVSLTAASTQLSMVVGDAVKFPTIAEGSGDNFPLTAVKANGELEIMLCTLTNGNVFTVQRGQEGTSPKAFSAGDRIELRLTAGTIDGMIDDRIDAAIEVVLDDLGTAAYTNLTESPIDTVDGRALKVGDFGLGKTLNYLSIGPSASNNPGLFHSSGFWQTSTGATGLPDGYTDNGSFIISAAYSDASSHSAQLLINRSSNSFRMSGRSRSSNQWSDWVEFYNTGNFPPVGFVYTQYPGEATPSALFGGTWSLLFNTEGITFRTEGGNSSSFGGGIQQDAYGSHSHSASSNSTGAHTHNTSGTAESAGAHAHTASSNSTGSHSHSGTASSAGAHTHGTGVYRRSDPGGVLDPQVTVVSPTSRVKPQNENVTASAGAHTHSLSINSAGDHSHTVSVASGGAHTHSVSGTAASAGAHSHTITVSASGSNETRMINRTIRVWKRTA